jgi:hypothetical protein
MNTPARTLVVAVALAALTALPAGAAHAREADEPGQQADQQQAREDPTYPAPVYRGPHAAQRTLARTLAREHLAYGTVPIDPAAQAAELALIRTLAREHLAYGTTNGQQAASTQPGDPHGPPAVVTVVGRVALIVVLAAVATVLWRRSRTRPWEAT